MCVNLSIEYINVSLTGGLKSLFCVPWGYSIAGSSKWSSYVLKMRTNGKGAESQQ